MNSLLIDVQLAKHVKRQNKTQLLKCQRLLDMKNADPFNGFVLIYFKKKEREMEVRKLTNSKYLAYSWQISSFHDDNGDFIA